MSCTLPRLAALLLAASLAGICEGVSAQQKARDTNAPAGVIARSRVWVRTDVAAMDLRRGPTGPGSFAPGAIVACEYVDEKLPGSSPKFSCRSGEDDDLKVKFGGTNGEVYGEVAASRLLWALGFGADRMYPVRVACRGCPRAFGGIARIDGDYFFDPAVIERKAAGVEIKIDGHGGWSWAEIDRIDEKAGGASAAERDALKLLAVLLQHTDSKPRQQRIVCRVEPSDNGYCARPFLMMNDVGLTFGRASRTNANAESAVNLEAWSRVPVWKGDTGCLGNLPKSFTGTLDNPPIGEDGRRFLADLLMQLTDRQLRDLFDVARVSLRPRSPSSGRSGFPAIEEWVDAFKEKRRQIVERRC